MMLTKRELARVLCTVMVATIALAQQLTDALTLQLEEPLGLNDDFSGGSQLFSLHRALVNIESTSGREYRVGAYLESHLADRNYTVERQYIDPLPASSPDADLQRFNLLAYPGATRQTPVLLSSHIDTVPPYYSYELRERDQIWGRGSVDAKACVATQLQAIDELIASNEIRPDDVSVLFVVGEETGGDGMNHANELNLSWKTVIFGEPTELKLASGHKGMLIFSLKVYGKAGHSGYPWLGKSANHMLVPALAALQRIKLPSSQKYGNSTLNVGFIQGGVASNVIAETAEAKIGIRIANGTPEIIKGLVSETVKTVNRDIVLEFHPWSYGPVDIDSDVEGFDVISVNYGTDIPNLKGRHKRYLYGPGNILVAHSDDECLTTHDLLSAVKGYKKLIKTALAPL